MYFVEVKYMNKVELFEKCLDTQINKLQKSIEKAKEARDNAPGAMESASDTRRSQAEKLVTALEEQLKELNRYSVGTNPSELAYLEVNMNSDVKKFLIVPEGLGGVEVGGVRLLSADSPLGQLLTGRKIGSKFEFNRQELEILKTE
jgi:transcription elongation GreA/GreB family factor